MNDEIQNKVMVNGRFHFPHSPATTEVQRGMTILTCVGEKAGFCAGVVVKRGEAKASYVLLGRLPVTSEYRSIPINLIDRIEGEIIHLNVTCAEILKLPLHQPA